MFFPNRSSLMFYYFLLSFLCLLQQISQNILRNVLWPTPNTFYLVVKTFLKQCNSIIPSNNDVLLFDGLLHIIPVEYNEVCGCNLIKCEKVYGIFVRLCIFSLFNTLVSKNGVVLCESLLVLVPVDFGVIPRNLEPAKS